MAKIKLAIIENLNKKSVVLVGLLLVIGIAVIDYLTGRELSFSLFYLLPIFWFTWLLGKRAGILTSMICTLLWYMNEVFFGQVYTHPGIDYWNSSIWLGFFLTVILLLAKLKHTLAQEAALARYDFLTGAANSHCFYELLQTKAGRVHLYQYPFTLAHIVLDYDKTGNDRFGHQVVTGFWWSWLMWAGRICAAAMS